jgi:hypothetical protein
MMAICSLCAIGAGIAMPLMFLVFGRLVGDFTGFFTPQSPAAKYLSMPQNSTVMHTSSMLLVARDTSQPMTKEQFMRAIDKNTFVKHSLFWSFTLNATR